MTYTYAPIADYAFLSDGHSAVLVSKSGSVDWACFPTFDSSSCFGRLLDARRGGYFSISPRHEGYRVRRRYQPGTLILETTFETERGTAQLVDTLLLTRGGRHHPKRQLLRVVRGISGNPVLSVDFAPSFEYGGVTPCVRRHEERTYSAFGGEGGLILQTDTSLRLEEGTQLRGHLHAQPEAEYRFLVTWKPSCEVFPGDPRTDSLSEAADRLRETSEIWRRRAEAHGPVADQPRVLRSAITVRGLVFEPTGAIVAAPTTSLPEAPGGSRNWDYRYAWIRDSSFALRSLSAVGYEGAAQGFRNFLQRVTASRAEELQVLYAISGRHRVDETALLDLEGYRGSHPVRVGNGAYNQVQFDKYGDVMDLAWRWTQRGEPPDPVYWQFLRDIVDTVCRDWTKPGCGIWEVRNEPRHFTYSKVMSWCAVDRGLAIAEHCGFPHPSAWREVRSAIRKAIESEGYDERRGVFVRGFDDRRMDASLLLLPRLDFVSRRDPRMIRTTRRVAAELEAGQGLLYRYLSEDGLPGREGAFLPCSFWLAESLALQGDAEGAARVFEAAEGFANDVGLFPEEIDPSNHTMLGNFPQGLTHFSHINAAVALASGHPAHEAVDAPSAVITPHHLVD